MAMAGAAHSSSDKQLQQIEQDAARFRIKAEDLKRMVGFEETAGTFAVWPENAKAVQLFLCCLTQWRYADSLAGSRRLGLDYGGVETVLRMNGLKGKRCRSVFADIQIMEVTAMGVFNG